MYVWRRFQGLLTDLVHRERATGTRVSCTSKNAMCVSMLLPLGVDFPPGEEQMNSPPPLSIFIFTAGV